jgi:ankyrin repeat protein
LDNGAEIDVEDNEGHTALSLAKEAGFTEIIEMLEDSRSHQ